MPMSPSLPKLATLSALLVVALGGVPSAAETLITTQPAAPVQTRNVQALGGEVRGEIVNQTDATVVGAELVVRHHWLWANETRPGTDDPGWVDVYALQVFIPPGGSAPFRVQASRVTPQRDDGAFQVEAFVRRFETIPAE